MRSLARISADLIIYFFISGIAVAIAADRPDSKGSPMVGITRVCSDATGFIAINETRGRIWTGQESYEAGERGLELDEAQVVTRQSTLSVRGVLQVTWGTTLYRTLMEGTISTQPNHKAELTFWGVRGEPNKRTFDCTFSKQ